MSENRDKLVVVWTSGDRDVALKMSRDLDILTETRVSAIDWINGHWEIFTDKVLKYESRYILLTMPVPQIINLLTNSKINVASTDSATGICDFYFLY